MSHCECQSTMKKSIWVPEPLHPTWDFPALTYLISKVSYNDGNNSNHYCYYQQ